MTATERGSRSILNRRRRGKSDVALIAGVVASGLLLAACGSSSGDSSEGPTELKVGYIPSSYFAPLFVGVEQGIFEKHGITITPTRAGGDTAATTAAMLSGSLDLSLGDSSQVLRAYSQGLPVQLVGPAYASAEDQQGVIVKDSSPIREAKDLTGELICSNSVGGSTELQTRAWVDDNGGDSSTLAFVSVPYPNIPAAVDAGRCAAGSTIQPFLAGALDSGMRSIGSDFEAYGDYGTVLASWYTTEEFASENSEALQAFADGIIEAQEYANKHHDAAAAVLPEMLDMTPEEAAKVTFTEWPTQLSVASLERMAQVLNEYGQASSVVEPNDVLWSGAPVLEKP